MNDYKCNNKKCDFNDEYLDTPSCREDIPEICPKCKKGKLVKQFPDCSKTGFDFVGPGFYINDYGKHNWRKGKTAAEQAGYLVKGDDGKYKDPY